MRRLTIEHQAGRHGRDAALRDEAGRRILGMSGDWGVTDDDGRTVLFFAPDYRGIVASAIVGGITGGILGDAPPPALASRNAGPGVETVKRARRPVRGIPTRWTPVATVSRQPGRAGDPTSYRVDIDEALPPVAFVQRVDPQALGGFSNGYADRREGIFDLVRVDGRPVLRHWAFIDPHLKLHTSTFDVEDSDYPLPEAVMLCLARWRAWRF